MATGAGDLVIRLFAQTGQFNRKMAGARRTMGLTSRAGVMLGRGIVLAGAAIAAAGVVSAVAFTRMLGAGETFNRSMRSSLAIMGDVSTFMRVDMRKAAIDMAATTRFSARETAEAFFFLASAGLDVKRSIDALPQVALFAQAGNFDIGRATQLATDAQSALGLKVKDTTQNLINLTRVTDVLTKANTLADATTEQFANAVANKAGAALKIVNKDIEEGVAVLAAFADQGKKGEEAGTALNIVFRELQTKSLKFAGAFRAAGVSVFDATGDMRNMADIIEDLERGLVGMSDGVKKTTLLNMGFTDRSMIFIQSLIGMSSEIRRFEKELRAAGGTTKEVADKQLTPLQEGMAKFGATISEIGGNLMLALGPSLGDAITVTAKAIRAIAISLGIVGDSAIETIKLINKLKERLLAATIVSLKFMRAFGTAAGTISQEERAVVNRAITDTTLQLALLLMANEEAERKLEKAFAADKAKQNIKELLGSVLETVKTGVARIRDAVSSGAGGAGGILSELMGEPSGIAAALVAATSDIRTKLTGIIGGIRGVIPGAPRGIAPDPEQVDKAMKRIRDLNDEYKRLTMGITKAAQEQRDFLSERVHPGIVKQLAETQARTAGARSSKALRERLMSPVERAITAAQEIERLFALGPDGGGISAETRRRALLAESVKLKADRNNPRQAAANARGSSEAWRTIMGAMNQKNKPTDKAIIDTAANTDRMANELEDQADDPPLNVIPPP